MVPAPAGWVLRLTDDEVLAIGASHEDGWRGLVPTVALDAGQMTLAAERGARSLWARDLYAVLADEAVEHPLRLSLEAAGSQPLISAFGAVPSSQLEPVGPVLNAFATASTDVVLIDVVHPDGRHELRASTTEEVEAIIVGETALAESGEGIPQGTCFVVVRRNGDEQSVTVTP